MAWAVREQAARSASGRVFALSEGAFATSSFVLDHLSALDHRLIFTEDSHKLERRGNLEVTAGVRVLSL